MENATPWTNTGGLRIQRAIITGWTLQDVDLSNISVNDNYNIYVTSKPAQGSGLYNPSFSVTNLRNAQDTVTVLLASYAADGRLLQVKSFEQVIGANSEANISTSLTPDTNAAENKFFVWRDGAPLAGITSIDQLP
jgi:hypothetical protein